MKLINITGILAISLLLGACTHTPVDSTSSPGKIEDAQVDNSNNVTSHQPETKSKTETYALPSPILVDSSSSLEEQSDAVSAEKTVPIIDDSASQKISAHTELTATENSAKITDKTHDSTVTAPSSATQDIKENKGYLLQVGALSDLDKANQWLAELSQKYAITGKVSSHENLYRVQLGPIKSLHQMIKLKEQLEKSLDKEDLFIIASP